MNTTKMDDETTITSPTLKVMEQSDKGGKIGDSDVLQKALRPLLSEFRTLRESVKSDYADLKQTITK